MRSDGEEVDSRTADGVGSGDSEADSRITDDMGSDDGEAEFVKTEGDSTASLTPSPGVVKAFPCNITSSSVAARTKDSVFFIGNLPYCFG